MKVLGKVRKKFKYFLAYKSFTNYRGCALWNFLYIKWIIFLSRSKGNQVYVISLFEHIGDIISCEPVAWHLKQTEPNSHIVWITNKVYRELVEHNPNIDTKIFISSFSQWIEIRKLLRGGDRFCRIIDLHLSPKYCNRFGQALLKDNYGVDRSNHLNKRGQLEAFTTAAGFTTLSSAPHFHLSNRINRARKIEGNYIVVHTSSNLETKDWERDKWENITLYFLDLGYQIVEIGLKKSIWVKHGSFIDYTGAKSFQEIAHIINDCLFFIGIDSGFAHMANALGKEGIVLIGEYHIEEYVHKRYNPFSGKYKDSKYVLYPSSGLAKNISVQDVIARFHSFIPK